MSYLTQLALKPLIFKLKNKSSQIIYLKRSPLTITSASSSVLKKSMGQLCLPDQTETYREKVLRLKREEQDGSLHEYCNLVYELNQKSNSLLTII